MDFSVLHPFVHSFFCVADDFEGGSLTPKWVNMRRKIGQKARENRQNIPIFLPILRAFLPFKVSIMSHFALLFRANLRCFFAVSDSSEGTIEGYFVNTQRRSARGRCCSLGAGEERGMPKGIWATSRHDVGMSHSSAMRLSMRGL